MAEPLERGHLGEPLNLLLGLSGAELFGLGGPGCPEPGITNHCPLTSVPTSVPWSWSKKAPFLPPVAPARARSQRSSPSRLDARLERNGRRPHHQCLRRRSR